MWNRANIPLFWKVLSEIIRFTCLGIPVLEFYDYAKVERALEERVDEVVEVGSDVVLLICGFILGVQFLRLKKTYNVTTVRLVTVCDFLIKFLYCIRMRIYV